MINGKLCGKHAQADRVMTGGSQDWGPGHPMPKGYTVKIMDGQRAMVHEWCAAGRGCGEAVDYCGIPNKANYYLHVIVGREDETSYSDIYVCDEHMPADLAARANDGWSFSVQDFPFDWDDVCKPVRELLKFDKANEWDVLEFRINTLR